MKKIFYNFKKKIKGFLNSKKFLNWYFYTKFKVYFLNLIDKQSLAVFKIKSLSEIKPQSKILDGYKYESNTQANTIINIPDLNLYIFNDALVNSRSSAIVVKNNLYYESINVEERFNEGFIKYHSKKVAVLSKINTEIIEEGFFLAGNGSYNWYHWIIEILPKMMFFNTKNTDTILVDESCEYTKSMTDSLKYFTDDLNIKIRYLKADTSYKVKKLFFINEVHKMMFNSMNENFTYPLYYFRQDCLVNFGEILTKKTSIDKKISKKIYLDRENTHRIAKNNDDIKNLVETKNFKILDVSKLTFDQQISKFNNATEILGISGAAWTNILFCSENTKLVMFMPDNFTTFKFYEEIAIIKNLNFQYLYYENNGEGHSESNFSIDLNQLNSLI